jgi:copper chaperone CopZ
MKKLLLFSVLVIGAILIGCGGKDAAEVKPEATLATATIELPTAKCGMCKKTIKTAVVDGTGAADVKFTGESPAIVATVSFDPSKTSEKAIAEAIGKAGYNAKGVVRDSAAYENLHSCCK